MASSRAKALDERNDGNAARLKVPEAMRPVYEAVTALIDEFCEKHLNREYAEAGREMAALLARKRPSPLLKGRPASWACAIVRSIGFANFLDDPTQQPHMRLMDISKAFGVSDSNAAAKSSMIREMLKIHRFDPDWTLESNLDKNLLIWLLTVNGIPMDIRDAPREAQVVAYEQGLIPYIPADRLRGPRGEDA
jgi:hypothetical protein